ncbi:MAG: hypothetical protein KKG99_05990 [Bacteroidetes bacterium]|nr:hypothetical protein [Bacteroidota bacterium]
MNVFLIENDKSVIAKLLHNNDVVICFNYLPYLSLSKSEQCKEVFFIDDLFSGKDFSNLQEITDEFTSYWYNKPEGDISQYNGFSFGEISRILINKSYLLNILVKYGEVIRWAVSQFKPEHVFCDFSDNENTFYKNGNDVERIFSKVELAELVCKQLDITLTFIPCNQVIPSGIIANQKLQIKSKTSVKRIIQQLIRKILITFLEYTINKINILRHRGKTRIFINNYPNLISLIENQKAHLFIPNLYVKKLINHFHTSFINLETTKTPLSKFDDQFLTALSARIKNKSNNSYCYHGIDYSPFYQRVAIQLTSNEIPNLLLSRNKLEWALIKNKIKIMIDIESEGENAQLRKDICKRNDILYAFVDHGIQGFRASSSIAQIPDYDIRFLAGSYDPYNKNDIHCVTGSPCIDPYFKTSKKEIKKIHRVLFLSFEDNHFARMDRFAFREKYLAEIIPLFPQLAKKGIEVYFRPHNESAEYFKYIFEFVGVKENSLKFNSFFSIPFSEIIGTMDLLVCNVSSCFFEAQAAGIPTIFFEPNLIEGSLCLPYSGLNWDEVIRLSKGEELLDIVLRNINDASELTGFLTNFLEKYGNKYIGQIDGKSGERIVDFLIEQAKK